MCSQRKLKLSVHLKCSKLALVAPLLLMQHRLRDSDDAQAKLQAATAETEQLRGQLKAAEQHHRAQEHKSQTNLLAEQRKVLPCHGSCILLIITDRKQVLPLHRCHASDVHVA